MHCWGGLPCVGNAIEAKPSLRKGSRSHLRWLNCFAFHMVWYPTKYQLEEWASTRVDCFTKAETILISSLSSPHSSAGYLQCIMLYIVHTVSRFCTANLRSRRKYKISLIFISTLGYSYLLLMTHWSTSLSLLLNPCQPCDFVSAQAVSAIGKSWLKLTQITNSLW